MTTPASLQHTLSRHRVAIIAGAVVLFHALVIWALQSGLLRRAIEVVVPVEVLAQLIEPPKPIPPVPVVPKEPPPPAPPPPVKQTVVKPTPPTPPTPVPQTQAAPQILAVEQATPAANAPAAVPTAPPAPSLPPSVPVAAVAAPAPSAPTSAPAKVVLPSSVAAYLNNPKPPYPRMSNTMGEQGSVMVRILVGVDGLPKEVELQKTSGFERLDKAALAGVMQWRFVPGKRDGVPEEMWMGTTVKFVLGQ